MASCPICRKPVTARFHPFCSRRCADVDLGRWFTGLYRIPTAEAPETAEPDRLDRDEGLG